MPDQFVFAHLTRPDLVEGKLMAIAQKVGFGAVALTGRKELRNYRIVRQSDRLRWTLLDYSPLIEHGDSSRNQKRAVKVVGNHKDSNARAPKSRGSRSE